MDLNVISDAINQLIKGPIWGLLVVFLIAIGYGLKCIPQFPNRLIPITLMLVGAAFMALLGNVSTLPPEQNHPRVVFALLGFVLGAVAWACHGFILKKIEKKFGWFQPDEPASDQKQITPENKQ